MIAAKSAVPVGWSPMPGSERAGGTSGRGADEVHQPGAGPERDAIEAGLAGLLARLAVGGDRPIDQARVERRQVLVAHAQPRPRVQRRVGDEDVDVAHEPVEELLPVLRAQVDRHAALGAIVDDPRVVVRARRIAGAAHAVDVTRSAAPP